MKRCTRAPAEPPFWRPLLCHVLGVSPRLAKTLWRSVCRSQSPAVVAWRYRLDVFTSRVATRDDAVLERFVDATWEPHRICAVIEALITDNLLNRAQGTELEEACFRHMNQGAWRA